MDPVVYGDVSARVMRRLVRLRKQRGLSAQVFADLVTDHGYRLTRSMLAKHEAGRVAHVSVDFLLAAAGALRVPAAALLEETTCKVCRFRPPPAPRACDTCGYAP